jgi:hypothetical protein
VLTKLSVSKFRALREFRMTGLGRVNLLVGTNNCGKTSVLEALSILVTPGSLAQILYALFRRGEVHDAVDAPVEVDLAHLFNGHSLEPNAAFTIEGANESTLQKVHARVVEWDPTFPTPHHLRLTSAQFPEAFAEGVEGEPRLDRILLDLSWTLGDQKQEYRLPISRHGGLLLDAMLSNARTLRSDLPPVEFITTEGSSREKIVAM